MYMPQWQEYAEAVREMMRCGFSFNAASIRDSCAVYKEELMKTAWAPSRIEKWLECGYDAFADM
jgi:hypothetical protein